MNYMLDACHCEGLRMQQSRDNRYNQSLRSLLEIQNEIGVL
jgi:hypothetical protein